MNDSPADIVHLAEPLRGVADLGDAGISTLFSGLGGRLANLSRADGLTEVIDAVARRRPDYVVLGVAEPAALAALRTALRTATLGVLIVQRDAPSGVPVDVDLSPQIEVEPVDPARGLNDFTLRLRGLMRRCRPVALSGRRSAGGVTLDEAAMTVAVGAATAPLSLEDFRLLGPLFDRPGKVWSREDLLRLAYGFDTANAVRTIDVKLNRTRRRLRAALGSDPIRSVRGVGYMLDPDA